VINEGGDPVFSFVLSMPDGMYTLEEVLHYLPF
jgi:hypothetical protein